MHFVLNIYQREILKQVFIVLQPFTILETILLYNSSPYIFNRTCSSSATNQDIKPENVQTEPKEANQADESTERLDKFLQKTQRQEKEVMKTTPRNQLKNRVRMMSIKWTPSNRTSTQMRRIFERTGRINA